MKKILEHLKSDWYKHVLEILVVVIGIMVAFSLNNWNESKKENKQEREYYGDLLEELRTDLLEIQGNSRYNQYYMKRYELAREIILNDPGMQRADTLGLIAIELRSFSDFKKNNSVYELLLGSGKLDIIGNKKILYRLEKLGSLYVYINRLEKNHEAFVFLVIPEVGSYIRLNPFEVMRPKQLYDFTFHNHFELALVLVREKQELYEQAEKDLNELIGLLNKELDR